MGKLCNSTQYFVIEKRVGGGKPRKEVRELPGLDPLSSKSVSEIRHDHDLRILR